MYSKTVQTCCKLLKLLKIMWLEFYKQNINIVKITLFYFLSIMYIKIRNEFYLKIDVAAFLVTFCP